MTSMVVHRSNGWSVRFLEELAEKIMVGIASAATHAYRDRGVVLFRNQNIKPGSLDDSDLLFIDESFEAAFKNKRLKFGDLLTARTGYPGVTGIVPRRYEGAQSFTTLITRPRTSLVDPSYLCYFINSEAGQSYFEQNQIGGAQKNVNASSLKRLPVLLPSSIEEQEAIATALSDTDALISSLERLIEKKRNIKQGAMQELLTGKRRLPGFSGEWKLVTFGELGSFYSGGTPNTKEARFYGGDIPWITSSDLNNIRIQSVNGRITKSGLENSSAQMVKAGTLLIAMYGATAGVCAITEISAAINQAVLAVIFDNSNTEFFLQRLILAKDWIIKTYTQGGQPNLSGQIIKSIELQIPDRKEQDAIADVLREMDLEIDVLETQLEKLQQVKQGMMQNLLTGKIRLI